MSLSAGVHSTYPTANAVTTSPQNYLINIMFNPENLHRPQLDIARTFIHELLHVEIYRKLLSCANLPNVNINNYSEAQWQVYISSLKNNFPGLFDYYMRYLYTLPPEKQLSDVQHELMSQHYRKIIIQVIRQFDDNSHSDEFYNALSWIGLMGDGVFNSATGLTDNPTVAWKNVPLNERLQIKAIYDNFLNSNIPCQ